MLGRSTVRLSAALRPRWREVTALRARAARPGTNAPRVATRNGEPHGPQQPHRPVERQASPGAFVPPATPDPAAVRRRSRDGPADPATTLRRPRLRRPSSSDRYARLGRVASALSRPAPKSRPRAWRRTGLDSAATGRRVRPGGCQLAPVAPASPGTRRPRDTSRAPEAVSLLRSATLSAAATPRSGRRRIPLRSRTLGQGHVRGASPSVRLKMPRLRAAESAQGLRGAPRAAPGAYRAAKNKVLAALVFRSAESLPKPKPTLLRRLWSDAGICDPDRNPTGQIGSAARRSVNSPPGCPSQECRRMRRRRQISNRRHRTPRCPDRTRDQCRRCPRRTNGCEWELRETASLAQRGRCASHRPMRGLLTTGSTACTYSGERRWTTSTPPPRWRD